MIFNHTLPLLDDVVLLRLLHSGYLHLVHLHALPTGFNFHVVRLQRDPNEIVDRIQTLCGISGYIDTKLAHDIVDLGC